MVQIHHIILNEWRRQPTHRAYTIFPTPCSDARSSTDAFTGRFERFRHFASCQRRRPTSTGSYEAPRIATSKDPKARPPLVEIPLESLQLRRPVPEIPSLVAGMKRRSVAPESGGFENTVVLSFLRRSAHFYFPYIGGCAEGRSHTCTRILTSFVVFSRRRTYAFNICFFPSSVPYPHISSTSPLLRRRMTLSVTNGSGEYVPAHFETPNSLSIV